MLKEKNKKNFHYQKITEAAILSCRNKLLFKKFLPNTFVRDIVFNKEVFEFYQFYKDCDLFYPSQFLCHTHTLSHLYELSSVSRILLNLVFLSNKRNSLTELCL